jgi:hypothetical protein
VFERLESVALRKESPYGGIPRDRILAVRHRVRADRVNVRSVRARDTVSTTTSTAVMRSGSFCSSDNCRTRGPAAVAVVGSDVVGGRAIAR